MKLSVDIFHLFTAYLSRFISLRNKKLLRISHTCPGAKRDKRTKHFHWKQNQKQRRTKVLIRDGQREWKRNKRRLFQQGNAKRRCNWIFLSSKEKMFEEENCS